MDGESVTAATVGAGDRHNIAAAEGFDVCNGQRALSLGQRCGWARPQRGRAQPLTTANRFAVVA